MDDDAGVDAGVDPVEVYPDEGVDELAEDDDDDDDSEEDEDVELDSLFELEDPESPLLSLADELCDPAPLSCFPPAEALGFERFGSFILLE
ncbi:MAG: hypothetical protein O2999_13140 [Nitrospirae bacterium]|nr:hypothetical protein [Nitrospirota bacterium]MDA1305218.1 hypothetical protein [Nitrospirota bacterium]